MIANRIIGFLFGMLFASTCFYILFLGLALVIMSFPGVDGKPLQIANETIGRILFSSWIFMLGLVFLIRCIGLVITQKGEERE